MTEVEIWEPRYHDETVLVMTSKINPYGDTLIRIQKGHYKGHYRIPAEAAKNCRTEWKMSKAGNTNKFTVIPLGMLTKDNPPTDDDLDKVLDALFD